jgi:hypothetical protein
VLRTMMTCNPLASVVRNKSCAWEETGSSKATDEKTASKRDLAPKFFAIIM